MPHPNRAFCGMGGIKGAKPKKPHYEPVVEAGVVEAAGVLLLLSPEVEAGLLSFVPLPELAFDSDLESDLALLSAPAPSPDELLSDELLFEA